MDRRKKIKITLTIILSVIEFIILYLLRKQGFFSSFTDENIGWIHDFLSYVTPAGIIFLINYYIIESVLYQILYWVWQLMGHYEYVAKWLHEQTDNCIAWLNLAAKHWGSLNNSEECQNANTCEALIAMQKMNYVEKYKNIYDNARNDLYKNVTTKGLQSKSLQYETVVCTSMILYLNALEKNSGKPVENLTEETFQRIAKGLWECRSERGWGVYVEKMGPEFACVANTFWALRALNYYDISEREEYAKFVKSIYEYSHNSTFGFVIEDGPRVCTTAMAVILYFSLEKEIQKSIDQVFNVNIAINYVFEKFCIKNIQCETESLVGIDIKCPGSKKAPWTHMTMGFAMEALNLAYKNGRLSLAKMDIYIHKVKTLCKKRLVYVSESHCYFIPEGMELRGNGIFTFPTAYFLMGLSGLVDCE